MTNKTAIIKKIYRYPVKGMTGQSLTKISVPTGEAIPWDRAFAIENGDSGFDVINPKHLPKQHFLMLMRDEELAKLTCTFNENSGTLEINECGDHIVTASLNSSEGQREIEQALESRFKGRLKGPLKILHKTGHSFSDISEKVLHLVNLNTLKELEVTIGHKIHPMRFRANLYIDGLPAWEEFNWVNCKINSDDIELFGFDRTTRCAATEVDPESGLRNINLPQKLLQQYNHADCGIYLKVSNGGTLSVGSQLTPSN